MMNFKDLLEFYRFHSKFYDPLLYNDNIWGENEDKKEKIKNLYKEILNCRKCKELNILKYDGESTTCVFPRGSVDAKIMFIGQSNARPQAQPNWELQKFNKIFWPNLPFYKGSGDILNYILELLCLDRTKVWITNVVKGHPLGNRNNLREEVENCSFFLKEEIKIIEPELIVCLGIEAAKFFQLNRSDKEKVKIKKIGEKNLKILYIDHPAYPLRSKKTDFINTYIENSVNKIIQALSYEINKR